MTHRYREQAHSYRVFGDRKMKRLS
jgi:hypothetical protein